MCFCCEEVPVKEVGKKNKGVLYFDPVSRTWVKLTGVTVSTIYKSSFLQRSASRFLEKYRLWTRPSSFLFWSHTRIFTLTFSCDVKSLVKPLSLT